MSEITQQTLRFYRQSTLPARATMEELLDSVLDMYSARLSTQGIMLERRYEPSLDVYCFAGEIRQVISNLVSNAIDATAGGGRLIVRARRSRDWVHPVRDGVRMTIADTGSGMIRGVRERLFEAFLYDQGRNRHRTGTLGESRDHPQASWNYPPAQPRGGGGSFRGDGLPDLLSGQRGFKQQGRGGRAGGGEGLERETRNSGRNLDLGSQLPKRGTFAGDSGW